ncbi:hypothetical protein KEM52_002345 [Ascosphaera acerosa]|nr:hypothetical protein KEM52_002345 [Ascosphaera acerosa]
MSAVNPTLSLYRRSLKLALDWAVHRNLWRGQAVYIRSLFDANRHVSDPRRKEAISTRGTYRCRPAGVSPIRQIFQSQDSPRACQDASS